MYFTNNMKHILFFKIAEFDIKKRQIQEITKHKSYIIQEDYSPEC